MSIEFKSFYFFSTEGFAPELPVEATFVKHMKNKKNREAILIRCDRKVSLYKSEYLILVPKHKGDSFLSLNDSDQIFTYVINGMEYREEDYIDLMQGSKIVLDWGGISYSLDIANKWQVKETEM